MMKTTFYTGRGDAGSSTMNSKKYQKGEDVFMLLGTLDECNSWLGLAKVEAKKRKKTQSMVIWLTELQEFLFIAQAEIATVVFDYGSYADPLRKFPYIKAEQVTRCEVLIQELDKELPELKKFILPGGSRLSACCDIARTVARKAERYAVIVTKKNSLSPELLSFLNRLSSVLFVLGRYANHVMGIAEAHPSY